MNQPAAPLARTDDASDLARLTPEVVSSMTGYSLEQMRLITKTVAKDAPLIELASFLHACQKLHLDPLLKQAYWIRRRSREKVGNDWQDVYRGTLQIGIDGFRALADRQGNYIGSDTAEFRDWFEITDKKSGEIIMAPGYARVITRKIVQGHVGTFVGEARWREFCPQPPADAMWLRMPTLMLGKCAEAQSLRKGWPALLGGVEMLNEDTDAADLIELPAPRIQVEPASAPVPARSVAEVQAQAERETAAYKRAYVDDDFPTSYAKPAAWRTTATPAREEPKPPDPEPQPQPQPSPDEGDDDSDAKYLLDKYNEYLAACKRALGDQLNEADWKLDDDASIEEIEYSSKGLQELLEQAGEKTKPQRSRQAAASGGERF